MNIDIKLNLPYPPRLGAEQLVFTKEGKRELKMRHPIMRRPIIIIGCPEMTNIRAVPVTILVIQRACMRIYINESDIASVRE
jgi:hypothetical protein